MSYADDLKHPLWQQCRLRVFERAEFHCQRCGGGSLQLHAHHKTYLRGRKPWDYPASLLECLCDPCHLKAHDEKERLEIMVAEHPTSELPRLTRLIGRLGDVLRSDVSAMRASAMNALQDELDAAEDFNRGAGFVEERRLEVTQA